MRLTKCPAPLLLKAQQNVSDPLVQSSLWFIEADSLAPCASDGPLHPPHRCGPSLSAPSMRLEILHLALMLLGGLAGVEGAEVASAAGLSSFLRE
ncbi:hypothetical protein ACFX5Q_26455 [Mesorhizobium sp. IMUNJ 23033]|uniref:hypothetical protein n=1 Tax=Mesorhizobium sp. IMUNJ 23033 TaxID=3378039 RepID=UPI00384B6C38